MNDTPLTLVHITDADGNPVPESGGRITSTTAACGEEGGRHPFADAPDWRPGTLWLHYKSRFPGGKVRLYEVVAVSAQEFDGLMFVVYRCLTTGRVWHRPLSEWQEQVSVTVGGETVTLPRFSFVGRK